VKTGTHKYKKMKENILSFVKGNEIIVGIISLFLGLCYLVYKVDKEIAQKDIKKNISRRVSDNGSYGVIIFLIIGGIIFILRGI